MGDKGSLCKCVESRTTVEITRYRMSGMYVCLQNTLLAMIFTIYFMSNTASLVEHPIHREVCIAFVGYKTAEVHDIRKLHG